MLYILSCAVHAVQSMLYDRALFFVTALCACHPLPIRCCRTHAMLQRPSCAVLWCRRMRRRKCHPLQTAWSAQVRPPPPPSTPHYPRAGLRPWIPPITTPTGQPPCYVHLQTYGVKRDLYKQSFKLCCYASQASELVPPFDLTLHLPPSSTHFPPPAPPFPCPHTHVCLYLFLLLIHVGATWA